MEQLMEAHLLLGIHMSLVSFQNPKRILLSLANWSWVQNKKQWLSFFPALNPGFHPQPLSLLQPHLLAAFTFPFPGSAGNTSVHYITESRSTASYRKPVLLINREHISSFYLWKNRLILGYGLLGMNHCFYRSGKLHLYLELHLICRMVFPFYKNLC